MKTHGHEKKAFTVITAVLMVGFLLILTTGVLNLVLREMKDNKGQERYLQSYAAAEGAMELGLLGIKEKGYPFDKDLALTSSGAEVLGFGTSFEKKHDPKISYNSDIKTDTYIGELQPGKTDIIPLFSEDTTGIEGSKKLKLTLNAGTEANVVWNVIGLQEGLSGTGITLFNNGMVGYRKVNGFGNATVKTFLQESENEQSYLVIFNSSPSLDIKYTLKDTGGGFFSKPIGVLTSTAIVGQYRQNIRTSINNTEFLHMLRYSIYNKN